VISAYVRDALSALGLSGCVERVEAGGTLDDAQCEALSAAPLSAVGALADAVRVRVRRDDVRLLADGAAAARQRPVVLTAAAETGPELMMSIALCRLSTASGSSVGVRADAGPSVVEAALSFGADAIVMSGAAKQPLQVIDEGASLAQQLEQVVRRCGRVATWERRPRPSVEQAS